MTDYLDRMSKFASEITYKDMDENVKESARNVIMDTIGAIIGGSRLPENGNLARLVNNNLEHGTATIIGHTFKASPMMATLANATAGVCLEMDEGTRLGGGHPAIHILPGVLSVAEEMGMGGQKLIEGLVAGYEVSSRIGGATKTRPNVHSHGTWGTIGTAVAVARLFNFHADQMRQVINLATSMSPANSWTPCFEGATIRNIYPGRSGMQGILAVHLQQCGFTSLHDAPMDMYTTILGDDFDSEAAVSGLGNTKLRIEKNYFKFHACCLYNHPILDAVEALVAREKFGYSDIDHIEITTVPFSARMAQNYPSNTLSAKFHIPFAVATLLVTGKTDITAFNPDVIRNDLIMDVANQVKVNTDPNMNMLRSDYPCATVSIGLKSGNILTESTTFVRGDFANRRPYIELTDKFLFLASPVLGNAKSRKALQAINSLEIIEDIRGFTSILKGISKGC